MNLIAEITKPHLKKNVPDLRIGDTIRVHQKIRDIDAKGRDRERVQIFEGVVIAKKHGNGIEGTFTVRKIAVGGIGVERVFPLHSPHIVKIERTKSAHIRQSKLYYLRKLQSSTTRLPRERAHKTVWEEKGAEKEIEAMSEAAAQAADEKGEEENSGSEADTSPETKGQTAMDESQELSGSSEKS